MSAPSTTMSHPDLMNPVPKLADPVMEYFTAGHVLRHNSYFFESTSAEDFKHRLKKRNYSYMSVGLQVHGCLDMFFEGQEWFQKKNGYPATVTKVDSDFFRHPFAFRFHAVTKALEGYPLISRDPAENWRKVPRRLDILDDATKWQTYVQNLKKKFEDGTFCTEDEFWDDYWKETGGVGESPFKPSRMLPRVKLLLVNKDFLNSRSLEDFVAKMDRKYRY